MNTNALIEAAQSARPNAYAPYSVYQVGAAILGADGRIYSGVNVENLSYGATVCAERNAIGAMVVAGCREIVAIAVATRDGVTPCGVCRQVIVEFCSDPTSVKVFSIAEDGRINEATVAELLPMRFETNLGKR